jgi:hypothetical protein
LVEIDTPHREAGGRRDEMAGDGIRGIDVDGAEPKELMLSDGSRLRLEGGTTEQPRAIWRRRDGDGRDRDVLTVDQAIAIAGPEHAGYVEVRTRAEAEWLRAVSDWYGEQANALADELRLARA